MGWNKIELQIIEELKERGYPGSVQETAAGAIHDSPDKAKEIRAKALSSKTAREVVKAMQPYLK